MKKFTALLVFILLFFSQSGAIAQTAFDATPSAMTLSSFDNNVYDSWWTAVQISLLIAVFYLLYWLKEGAFD